MPRWMRCITRGLRVIPVTGRPAGWCDHFARMWPVHGVVGENGAFYMWHDAASGRLRTRHLLDEAQRAETSSRLVAVRAQVLREVPGCAVASDQFCRLYDLAIDFCEDVPPLPAAAVDRIVALDAGRRHDGQGELDPRQRLVRPVGQARHRAPDAAERFGIDLDAERERIVFAGDSPNDEPMFAYFAHAVGVANVLAFRDRMRALPLPQPITWSRHSSGSA
jgi:hypothetical protein